MSAESNGVRAKHILEIELLMSGDRKCGPLSNNHPHVVPEWNRIKVDGIAGG